MTRGSTTAALVVPCSVCALIDVLVFPDTDPKTAVCRECVADDALDKIMEIIHDHQRLPSARSRQRCNCDWDGDSHAQHLTELIRGVLRG